MLKQRFVRNGCHLLICRWLGLLVVVAWTNVIIVNGTASVRPTTISIINFGASEFAKAATERIRATFKATKTVSIADAELSHAAAKGSGYSGSLNLTLAEARDLGAALASDFYLIGDAQTIRRSSSSKPIFFESYASIFVISSRSGKLVRWERPSFEGDTRTAAEEQLLAELGDSKLLNRLLDSIQQVELSERAERTIVLDQAPLIEEAPDDENIAAAQGLRLPRPFRRLRPEYPQTAAKADAEATVDVLVDVGSDGEVGQVEVVRWAGFGLDEATVATVRQLHFFPAMKNGTAVPLRVLLRYNFRKPLRP